MRSGSSRIRFEPDFSAGTLIARETGATQLWGVGAIVVRPREPNSIFGGYWRRAEASVETRRNLWHHTGDLGYFDSACLVLAPGAVVEWPTLFQYFSANLPYYAIPRYVQVMDELPANAVGRVLKHKLRDDWNAPGTVDFLALGLTIEKSARRCRRPARPRQRRGRSRLLPGARTGGRAARRPTCRRSGAAAGSAPGGGG